MKKFMNAIKNFFFPPQGSSIWIRLLPYGALGVLTLFVLTGGVYTWEYTNSPQFCGSTCHTMPPEYNSYQVSPHARIACVDCHIGKGFIATRITRKAGDIRHVTATAFKTYEFPIRAGELRPARETCELCHFPEKFSDDSLREIKRFGNDANNTPTSTYLTLKTGGGSERQGLGRGIHWHIQNQIKYLPADSEEQEIPYVQVTLPDGSVQEFVDIESGLNPSSVNPEELKDMDCITCHNRITHLVEPPEDTVDQMIANGVISESIPEIRRMAVEVYSQVYDSTEKGLSHIASLEEFYKTYYPDFYAENPELVQSAIKNLQDSYRTSVYPEQNSDWTTHPNNIGHKDSPGCFRCHDGKHLDSQNQAIRLECNLCHSIPVVAGPNDFVANIEISRGPEPESHKNPNWISLHNQVFDETCTSCHTTDDPGGTSNTSFCSNSACHGSAWEFAGFDAPALREILVSQMPEKPTPQPVPAVEEITYENLVGSLLLERCGSCHKAKDGLQGLNLTTYDGIMTGSVNGPVIIPGDPENSLLYQKMTGEKPHFAQLNDQELEWIVGWIKSGAPQE